MPDYIVITMVLIVLALAAYAASLCLQVYQKKQQSKQSQLAQAQQVQQRRESAQQSIDIILRCLLQNQVSLTEAAIRVSGLSKGLKPSTLEQEFYQPFDALALATSHIPILGDWKKLSRAEQRKYDVEREEIENSHRDRVMDAARRLVQAQ